VGALDNIGHGVECSRVGFTRSRHEVAKGYGTKDRMNDLSKKRCLGETICSYGSSSRR
jgi:hypothetical protein